MAFHLMAKKEAAAESCCGLFSRQVQNSSACRIYCKLFRPESGDFYMLMLVFGHVLFWLSSRSHWFAKAEVATTARTLPQAADIRDILGRHDVRAA